MSHSQPASNVVSLQPVASENSAPSPTPVANTILFDSSALSNPDSFMGAANKSSGSNLNKNSSFGDILTQLGRISKESPANVVGILISVVGSIVAKFGKLVSFDSCPDDPWVSLLIALSFSFTLAGLTFFAVISLGPKTTKRSLLSFGEVLKAKSKTASGAAIGVFFFALGFLFVTGDISDCLPWFTSTTWIVIGSVILTLTVLTILIVKILVLVLDPNGRANLWGVMAAVATIGAKTIIDSKDADPVESLQHTVVGSQAALTYIKSLNPKSLKNEKKNIQKIDISNSLKSNGLGFMSGSGLIASYVAIQTLSPSMSMKTVYDLAIITKAIFSNIAGLNSHGIDLLKNPRTMSYVLAIASFPSAADLLNRDGFYRYLSPGPAGNLLVDRLNNIIKKQCAVSDAYSAIRAQKTQVLFSQRRSHISAICLGLRGFSFCDPHVFQKFLLLQKLLTNKTKMNWPISKVSKEVEENIEKSSQIPGLLPYFADSDDDDAADPEIASQGSHATGGTQESDTTIESEPGAESDAQQVVDRSTEMELKVLQNNSPESDPQPSSSNINPLGNVKAGKNSSSPVNSISDEVLTFLAHFASAYGVQTKFAWDLNLLRKQLNGTLFFAFLEECSFVFDSATLERLINNILPEPEVAEKLRFLDPSFRFQESKVDNLSSSAEQAALDANDPTVSDPNVAKRVKIMRLLSQIEPRLPIQVIVRRTYLTIPKNIVGEELVNTFFIRILSELMVRSQCIINIDPSIPPALYGLLTFITGKEYTNPQSLIKAAVSKVSKVHAPMLALYFNQMCGLRTNLPFAQTVDFVLSEVSSDRHKNVIRKIMLSNPGNPSTVRVSVEQIAEYFNFSSNFSIDPDPAATILKKLYYSQFKDLTAGVETRVFEAIVSQRFSFQPTFTGIFTTKAEFDAHFPNFLPSEDSDIPAISRRLAMLKNLYDADKIDQLCSYLQIADFMPADIRSSLAKLQGTATQFTTNQLVIAYLKKRIPHLWAAVLARASIGSSTIVINQAVFGLMLANSVSSAAREFVYTLSVPSMPINLVTASQLLSVRMQNSSIPILTHFFELAGQVSNDFDSAIALSMNRIANQYQTSAVETIAKIFAQFRTSLGFSLDQTHSIAADVLAKPKPFRRLSEIFVESYYYSAIAVLDTLDEQTGNALQIRDFVDFMFKMDKVIQSNFPEATLESGLSTLDTNPSVLIPKPRPLLAYKHLLATRLGPKPVYQPLFSASLFTDPGEALLGAGLFLPSNGVGYPLGLDSVLGSRISMFFSQFFEQVQDSLVQLTSVWDCQISTKHRKKSHFPLSGFAHGISAATNHLLGLTNTSDKALTSALNNFVAGTAITSGQLALEKVYSKQGAVERAESSHHAVTAVFDEFKANPRSDIFNLVRSALDAIDINLDSHISKLAAEENSVQIIENKGNNEIDWHATSLFDPSVDPESGAQHVTTEEDPVDLEDLEPGLLVN